jgi:O-antigen/teichoic acid export membrane protein
MLDRVAKNAVAQSLSQLVQFADRFLVVGILLRSWGTQIYSDWVILLSYAGVLSIGELGLNIYYGNVYQKAWAAADTKRFQRMISVATTCSGVVAVLLGCLALVFLAAADLPTKAMPHTEAIRVAVLMGAVTLSRIARGSISQIYRGRQEFAVGVLVDLLSPASALVFAIIAVLMGAAPVIVAGGYLTSDLIAGWGGMVWSINRRYPGLHLKPAYPNRRELFDLAHHVKWLAVQQQGTVAWLQIPVLVLGHVGVASASLVSFVVLRTLVNFMRSFGTMISNGSAVETAAIHHTGQWNEVIRGLRTIGRGLTMFSASMAVGLLLFGQPLVSIWTGRPELYNSAIVFSLLASAVLAAPAAPIAYHLTYAIAARPFAIALLVQYTIGFSACAVLARPCGAAGVAAGLAFGEAIGQAVALPLLAARHLTGFGFSRYLLGCVLAMILAAVWCGGIGLGALAIFDASRWPGLFAAGAAWTLLGFVPALVLAFSARQRKLLAEFIGLPGLWTRKSVA